MWRERGFDIVLEVLWLSCWLLVIYIICPDLYMEVLELA